MCSKTIHHKMMCSWRCVGTSNRSLLFFICHHTRFLNQVHGSRHLMLPAPLRFSHRHLLLLLWKRYLLIPSEQMHASTIFARNMIWIVVWSNYYRAVASGTIWSSAWQLMTPIWNSELIRSLTSSSCWKQMMRWWWAAEYCSAQSVSSHGDSDSYYDDASSSWSQWVVYQERHCYYCCFHWIQV